jgi:hypothetical protein
MVDANERYMPIGNVVIPVQNTSEQIMFRAKPHPHEAAIL